MASSSSVHPASSELQALSDPVSSLPPVQLPPPPSYKNDLQGLAQRCAIADPIYETVNEGYQHAPKFRSTVRVDGMRFTSELTFMRRKAAEQEAARIALECFTKKIKEEGHSFVRENAILCKSILEEYAAKTKKGKPTFNTTQHEGVVPYFQSSLDFNGRTYTGGAAINKMDAEHLAAQAAVLSTLGLSRLIIFEIIKSKSKFYDVVKTKSSQPVISNGVSPIANAAHYSIVKDHKAADSSVLIDHKDKEVADPVGNTDNNKVVMVETPESQSVLLTCQQSQIRKPEPGLEATSSLNMSHQPDSAVPIEDGLTSKKQRKRNNKKANKKARMEAELPPVGGVPVNQAQICRLSSVGGVPVNQAQICRVLPVGGVPVNQVPTCLHCGSVMKS